MEQRVYSVAFHLTPAMASVFGLLMASDVITAETIHQQLDVATDGRVAISRLRKHLNQLHKSGRVPFEVEICSKKRVGYWLTKETKDYVRTFVDERTGGAQRVQQHDPGGNGEVGGSTIISPV